MSEETPQDTPSEYTPPEHTPSEPVASGYTPAEPTEPLAATQPTMAAPAAEPVAAAPVAPTTAASERKTVAIPMSVLIGIAALIGALVMFGIGYAVGDSGNSSTSSAPIGVQTPANPFGQQGNGNGTQQLPANPFGQQGNGNGNGNGGTTLPQRPNQTTGSGAFLGVATQQATSGNGVEITQVVSGSAADDAGLKVGDVITTFDGQRVSTPSELGTAVASHQAGDKVQVTYNRDGETKTVTVTLATRNASSSN